jgi:hypothetical protein
MKSIVLESTKSAKLVFDAVILSHAAQRLRGVLDQKLVPCSCLRSYHGPARRMSKSRLDSARRAYGESRAITRGRPQLFLLSPRSRLCKKAISCEGYIQLHSTLGIKCVSSATPSRYQIPNKTKHFTDSTSTPQWEEV